MPFPFAALIPAGVSLLGGLLGKKDERNQVQDANRLAEEQRAAQDARDEAAQRARFNMGRGTFDRTSAGQAVRGGVSRELLSKYFKNLDPASLQRIGTPTPYPDFEFQPGGAAPLEKPVPGYTGFAGDFLSGIAPYIGLDEEQLRQAQVNRAGVGGPPLSPFEQYLARLSGGAAPQEPPIEPIAPNGNKVVGR